MRQEVDFVVPAFFAGNRDAAVFYGSSPACGKSEGSALGISFYGMRAAGRDGPVRRQAGPGAESETGNAAGICELDAGGWNPDNGPRPGNHGGMRGPAPLRPVGSAVSGVCRAGYGNPGQLSHQQYIIGKAVWRGGYPGTYGGGTGLAAGGAGCD